MFFSAIIRGTALTVIERHFNEHKSNRENYILFRPSFMHFDDNCNYFEDDFMGLYNYQIVDVD